MLDNINFNPEVINSVAHGFLFWFLVIMTLSGLHDMTKTKGPTEKKARTISKTEATYKALSNVLLWGIFLALFLTGF